MKLIEILKENTQIVSYSAVVLDGPSKDEILKNVEIPNDWKVINHHMTIKLGELPENLKNKKGEMVTLKITKVGKSDNAIAMGVETDLSLNAIPHITVAINAKIGAKPKDSNDIKNWEDIEPFTVKGWINEIMMESRYKAKGNPETLNVFDFDGTLMNSPLPEIGKPKYKELTGNEWPHKGWWGQIDSLQPFDVEPIEQTLELYKKYKNLPNSTTILMTNRISKFEPIVKQKLEGYYSFDYYNFKNDNREKPDRIMDILKNNPSIKTINIFDDMDEQIEKFNKFKLENPQYEINIFQIK